MITSRPSISRLDFKHALLQQIHILSHKIAFASTYLSTMSFSNTSPSVSNTQFRSALLVSSYRSPELSSLDPLSAKWDKHIRPKPLITQDIPKDSIFLAVGLLQILHLPFLYPLDHCNAKFSKAYLPFVISSLQSILRIASVHVRELTHGDATRTASVRCLTLEQVEFVIAFWDISDEQYCAEIQRTKGDTQTFWIHARRILDIIQGNKTTIPSDDPLCYDLETAKAFDSVYQTIGQRIFEKDFKVRTEDLEASINRLVEFLKKDHYDGDTIVLESLISMTDPTLSGTTTACTVAKMVMDPESVIFQRLVTLIQSMSDRLFNDHAHLALRIAAQCCGLVGTVERKNIAESIPMFISWLKDAASRGDPHVAYCSIHILSYFVNDGLVSDFGIPDGMLRFGSNSHVALEKACGRLSSAIAARGI